MTKAHVFCHVGKFFHNLLSVNIFTGNMTKTFEIRIQDEFLNADPKVRPRLSTLLQDRLFK